MTRRNHIIDDPVRPFRLKPGVRYRVVKDDEGRLVVREAKRHSQSTQNKQPALRVNP